MPTNYDDSKIYTLRSHQTDEIYIGSTTQEISKRLANHKTAFKRYNEGKSTNYLTSFKILEHDDAYIELLESFPCTNRMELCKREGELIRLMDCVNKNIAGRTGKQHYQDNKESILVKKKQYNDNHKVEKKQYDKKYRIDNRESINAKHECPCGGRYMQRHKKQHEMTNKHFDFMNLYVV